MIYGTISGYFIFEYKSDSDLENLIIVKDYIINIEIEQEYYYNKVYKFVCADCHESIKKEINLKIMFENIVAAINNGTQFCSGSKFMCGQYTFDVTYTRNISYDRINIA